MRLWTISVIVSLLFSGFLLVICSAKHVDLENNMDADPRPTLIPTLPEPFYGMQYVPSRDLSMVKELGVEVVLMNFSHDETPESWLAYLDAAHAQNIRVIAWLWPQGWTWDGTAWQIDDQARLFVKTVAGHPALFAVYALHEPYWNDCVECGYTTAEQQALYSAIKAIADVPIHSAVDSMSFWTSYSQETAFADGICDYCETWYYPFRKDDTYERDKLISRLTADLAIARERGPNSKIVWAMQSFAQGPPYNVRMPNADEMRDLASIVYTTDVDGALWYVWTFNDLYSDFLSTHPEFYPVVREIYEEFVVKAKYPIHSYLPIIYSQYLQELPIAAPTATMNPQCLDSWHRRPGYER